MTENIGEGRDGGRGSEERKRLLERKNRRVRNEWWIGEALEYKKKNERRGK